MSRKSRQQSAGPDFLTNFFMFWLCIAGIFGLRMYMSHKYFKDPVVEYRKYTQESDEFYRKHPELK